MTGKPSYEDLEQRIIKLESESMRNKLIEEALRERVKELNCLYSIADFIEKVDVLEELLQHVVNQMPYGWYYPEHACAKIIFNDQEFKTTNYQVTTWKLSSPLMVRGRPFGVVEVGYLEEKPGRDEGPFLKEERVLINAIAERLGHVIERKQTEKALQESEEKFRTLFENSSSAMAIIERDTTISMVNREYCKIGLFEEKEVIGKSWTTQIPPEDIERLKEYNQKRLIDPKSAPDHYEFSFYRRDGKIRHSLMSVAMIPTSQKIICSFVDITERKQVEEALRKSKEEYSLLIEMLPIAVSIDTQGKIVYVNPAFLTLFKASAPEQVIGMSLTDFASPELFDTVENRRRVMIEEKRTLPPLELNLRCMDGTFITVVSIPMPVIFQEQPAVLEALYDITERKRSEIELQKAHKLLQIQVAEIEGLQSKLKSQVIRDPLTGLYNRRYLEETLDREFARASREGIPIGIVMIDIDHFKEANDTYGHKAGDLILQALGNLLLGGIRTGDIACRYGGDEFLLILPQASKSITAERAEQWRFGFESLNIICDNNILHNTISLGIAVFPEDGMTAEALIHAADQALYRAKALGRDRIVLS
ncbi:MAG: hypothetical protein CSYNP_02256 [Syntrophus sp. SKADARSKE-3]|nr:hypothetical protein [Syntrophus sp. SKADARSKE-3]